MRITSFRVGLVTVVATAPLLLSSTIATAADSSVGAASPPTQSCTGADTYLQTSTDPTSPSYTVASSGIITSFRIAGAITATTRAFKLGRPQSGGSFLVVGSTDPASVAAGGTLTQQVRISTKAGDVLGVYVGQSSNCATNSSSTLDTYGQTAGNAGNGTTLTPSTLYVGRVQVAATVEPDADGDGYGDTTQDQCPTQAGTHGLCVFALSAIGRPVGVAKSGHRLSAPAVAAPAGATKAYQWFRLVKVRRHHHTHYVTRTIPGAHGATYRLRARDKGTKVSVAVTVSQAGYIPVKLTSPRTRVR